MVVVESSTLKLVSRLLFGVPRLLIYSLDQNVICLYTEDFCYNYNKLCMCEHKIHHENMQLMLT